MMPHEFRRELAAKLDAYAIEIAIANGSAVDRDEGGYKFHAGRVVGLHEAADMARELWRDFEDDENEEPQQ